MTIETADYQLKKGKTKFSLMLGLTESQTRNKEIQKGSEVGERFTEPAFV